MLQALTSTSHVSKWAVTAAAAAQTWDPTEAYDCSQHDILNSLVDRDIANIWGPSQLINETMQAEMRQQCVTVPFLDPPSRTKAFRMFPCHFLGVVIDQGVPYLTTPWPPGNPDGNGIMVGAWAWCLMHSHCVC